MKVLFVAHHPFGRIRTRTEHLVANFSSQMEAHVLTFSIERPWNDPGSVVRPWLGARKEDGVWIHHLLRLPRLHKLNGWFLTQSVRRIVKRYGIDLVVIAPNQYMIGSLDRKAIEVPVVCDYLDGFDWKQLPDHPRVAGEHDYLKMADAVLCVSHGLMDQAVHVNKNIFYVPNGVEMERYRSFAAAADMAECKSRLGLDPEALIVSLIGLTCSASAYFWEAVKRLNDAGVRTQLVLVGDGEIREKIRKSSGGYEHALRDFGRVPYEQVLDYFAATDIGLYPVDDFSYYHWAAPLKVFEYAAMGKPVIISPRLTELSRIDLRNFHYCEPTADALAECILRVGRLPGPIFDPRVEEFDWSRIATGCWQYCADLVSQRKGRL